MCARLGRTCDEIVADDNCGEERVAQCGECPLEVREYIEGVKPDKVVVVGRGARIAVNQVIISVKPGTSRAQVVELAASVGGRLIGQLPLIQLYQLEVPARTSEELYALIDRLDKHPLVASARTKIMVTLL